MYCPDITTTFPTENARYRFHKTCKFCHSELRDGDELYYNDDGKIVACCFCVNDYLDDEKKKELYDEWKEMHEQCIQGRRYGGY